MIGLCNQVIYTFLIADADLFSLRHYNFRTCLCCLMRVDFNMAKIAAADF
jgi:hypothetical protein